MGYENPMPVQEEVIPYLLGNGNDVVALAQTGTGKTAAFGLPLIQKVDVKHRAPQALILCPTRELCLQIAGDLNDYSKYIDGLKILPVYGGSSIESQIRMLKTGVHIIVATPGLMVAENIKVFRSSGTFSRIAFMLSVNPIFSISSASSITTSVNEDV